MNEIKYNYYNSKKKIQMGYESKQNRFFSYRMKKIYGSVKMLGSGSDFSYLVFVK